MKFPESSSSQNQLLSPVRRRRLPTMP